ncbi:MAG: DUF58 domain-containing protein [Candidatus Marinimicrobia bacterium]|nr:DUF58 domain-containing protein [Candidatus Neomarinimicrobiota bacterium]
MNQIQLTPEIISKLDNLSLKARMVVEGFIVGLHKSPYHGFSVEFSEHRAYGNGDEIKHIDWKLFGKTDRFYIKQFEEETNLRANILLDQSNSMIFSSQKISKLEYAKMLSASLTYLMIKQQDAVGLTLFDDQIRGYVPPRSKNNHLKVLLSKLDKIKCGNDTQISNVLHKTAEMIKQKGLIILISDLIDNPENIVSGLKHFRYKGNEVIVFHIIDYQELNLDYNENIRFQDLETKEEIITQPWHINKDYKKSTSSFCKNYKEKFLINQIDYVPLLTNQPLDLALSEFLIKRKRIL